MTGSLVAARDTAQNATRNAVADAVLAGTAVPAGAERTGTRPAPLLTVSRLSVSYGQLRALEDVSLSVRSGSR